MMGYVITTLGVIVVSVNLSVLHTSCMHMSIIYAWDIMAQNMLLYRLLHMY